MSNMALLSFLFISFTSLFASAHVELSCQFNTDSAVAQLSILGEDGNLSAELMTDSNELNKLDTSNVQVSTFNISDVDLTETSRRLNTVEALRFDLTQMKNHVGIKDPSAIQSVKIYQTFNRNIELIEIFDAKNQKLGLLFRLLGAHYALCK